MAKGISKLSDLNKKYGGSKDENKAAEAVIAKFKGKINSKQSIIDFFAALRNDMSTAFDPDTSFTQHTNNISKKNAKALDAIMDDCFKWCDENNEDLYELAMVNWGDNTDEKKEEFSDGGKPIGSTGIFEKGGKIANQYKGKQSWQIWAVLSTKQRAHFLSDHFPKMSKKRIANLSSQDEIKEHKIFDKFNHHVREGQYADGGKLDDPYYMPTNAEVKEMGQDKFIQHYLLSAYVSDFGSRKGFDTWASDSPAEYAAAERHGLRTYKASIGNRFEFGGQPLGSTGKFAKGGKAKKKKESEEEENLQRIADDMSVPVEVIKEWSNDTGSDAENARDAYEGRWDSMKDYAMESVEFQNIDPTQYLFMTDTDRRIVAGEEADRVWESLSDDEIIEKAELSDELSQIESKYEDDPYTAEKEKEKLVDKGKEKLSENAYDEIYKQLGDPIQYFVNDQGLYSKEDLAKQNFISVDYEKLGDDLKQDFTAIQHGGWLYLFRDNYADGGLLKPIGSTGLFSKGGKVQVFKREISLGKIDYNGTGRKINAVSVEVNIKTIDDAINWATLQEESNAPVVSMSGRIWNSNKTDIESGGQNLDDIGAFFKGNSNLQRLIKIWKQYHLNDLKSGTEKQVHALEAWADRPERGSSRYDAEVNYLKSIGLYDDRGHKYGHGWLYMPVPKEILQEIKELAESFPEFSRYENGGSVDAFDTMNSAEPSDYFEGESYPDEFAKGGVAKVANAGSNAYSENRIPFKGANLEGKELDNKDYVVLSYGHYPIWYYNTKEGKWYGNSDKYSVTTSKQMSQSRPTWEATMLPHQELLNKMRTEDARFDLGGLLVRPEFPLSVDNLDAAHSGSALDSQNATM